MKTRTILLLISMLVVGFLAGAIAGSKFSTWGHGPTLLTAFEEDGTRSVSLYTYYLDRSGKKVLHGKYYIVTPSTRTTKTYRDGALQGVDSSTINY